MVSALIGDMVGTTMTIIGEDKYMCWTAPFNNGMGETGLEGIVELEYIDRVGEC